MWVAEEKMAEGSFFYNSNKQKEKQNKTWNNMHKFYKSVQY